MIVTFGWLVLRLAIGSWKHREEAARTLGLSRDQRAVKPLVAALARVRPGTGYSSPPTVFRATVIWALGELRAAAAVPGLTSILLDKGDHSRSDAARSLGKIGDPSAVGSLVEALGDLSDNVRDSAAQSLLSFGAPSVMSLLRALRHNHHYVRAGAAKVLGEMGEPRAVELLTEMLSDDAYDVRRAALAALEKVGHLTTTQPLVAMLKSAKIRIFELWLRALWSGQVGKQRTTVSALRTRSPVATWTSSPTVDKLESKQLSMRFATGVLAEMR